MRLDVRIVELGLCASREKARALVMAGKVMVDGKPAQKPGTDVKESSSIEITGEAIPFVSRGGLKLEKGITDFGVSLTGLITADIGASTGGFTDCMLQHGAKKVYALDVGYGQLDWKLRNDPRVVVMERTNARNMAPDWFAERLQFASIDVSFISIRLILPALFNCLQDGAYVISLIKPQFEAGRYEVQKHGVIRDAAIHESVLHKLTSFALHTGFDVCGLGYSPITGPKGNIEYLAFLRKTNNIPGTPFSSLEIHIKYIVEESHRVLGNH